MSQRDACDRWARLLLILHLLALAALAAVTPWTTDEPNYLHAGIALRAQFEFSPYATILHGPLPLLANQLGAWLGAPLEPLVEYKLAGRLGMLPFAALAAWALWRFARALFGSRAALAALLLHATNPIVLAHGCLMTADLAATGLWTLCCWLAWRWLSAPSLPRLLGLGAALGVSFATKFLTLFLIPALGLALGIAALRGLRAQLWWTREADGAVRRLGDAALAVLLAGGTAWAALWTCYAWSPPGYSVVVRDVPPAEIDAQAPDAGVISRSFRGLVERPLVPAMLGALPAPFVRGLDYQKHYSEAGGRARLFDQRSAHGTGFPSYYAVAFALKLPLVFLVLLLLGIALRDPPWPKHAGVLVACGALLLPAYLSLFTAMQIGVRYALPVLPLFALVAGRPFARAGRYVPLGLGLLALLLLLQTALHWPRFLGWHNALAGGRPELVFADSNVDWPADWVPDADRAELLRRHPDATPVVEGSGPRLGKLIAHAFVLAQVAPRDEVNGDGNPDPDAQHALRFWLRGFTPIDREGAWLAFDIDPEEFAAWAGDDPRRNAELAVALLGAGELEAAARCLRGNRDPAVGDLVQDALQMLDILQHRDPQGPHAVVQWQKLGREDEILAMGSKAAPAFRAWALSLRGEHAAVVALLEPERQAGRLDAIEGYYLVFALYQTRREDEALALLRTLAPPVERTEDHERWESHLRRMEREIAAVHRLEERIGDLQVR